MHKKNKFFKLYVCFLIIWTIIVLLYVFIYTEKYVYMNIAETKAKKVTQNMDPGEITITDNSYRDDNIRIDIEEYFYDDTKVYVADIRVKKAEFLKTAFANNYYGKNITKNTSEIAEDVDAILAINGDFYGIQENGFVLREGTIYRDKNVKNREDLVIYENGSFDIINESTANIHTLLKNGAYNILSFGPCLINNFEYNVGTKTEVKNAKTTNPRTAIGVIDRLHYVFVVADGRTLESQGLSLYELATFMKEKYNVLIAYNLDGGGSSAMYFNGSLINNPTFNGSKITERSVSDIVYIGY